MQQHDILICGGGLVGASLALALSQLEFDVALAEAVPFGKPEQPSFDERTTAISNGTQRIFNALGVWPLIERSATPIKKIHVSDRGRFGFARIDAQEQDLPQLGFVVVNRVMGEALWRRLQESKVKIYAPARVTALKLVGDRQAITLTSDLQPTAYDLHGRRECRTSQEHCPASLQSRLVIAADGARSIVREAAGIGATHKDYEQTAVIATIACQKFHSHVAYERFTAEGPIAMLPLSDARVGLVWTLARKVANEVMQLNDADFIVRLQAAFGLRLGRFMQVGKRYSYALSLTQSEQHIAERLAIIGNAAQGLHPIAGQGFNLGLRDAACLAEVLADACRENPQVDPGGVGVLRRYADWRGEDRKGIVRFTDGLVRLFAQDFAPIKTVRDIGMLLFDLSPQAKDYLSQLSLGAAGKIPRMARGGSLRDPVNRE
ncbi:MAG TPA: 2-octaprenyl-6-methoxyphenyl hydroxylase [Steroidobacteraceae bacterium]|nr:2-octaprenyl-6-methoxyphenyl hydroxylase [Steroidobacteraceae bacterium]